MPAPLHDPTPRQIVEELDKYIVGQAAAKRAVAVALRNRLRRRRLPPALREEILPKNILMIGPTGVGKTEIARRLARLVEAPFVKVEATKFTEVGYVGRDVDTMVRDLVEASLRMVREEHARQVRGRAEEAARERLLEALVPAPRARSGFRNPLEALMQGFGGAPEPEPPPEERQALAARRREVALRLDAGELEGESVEIEVEESRPPLLEMFGGQGSESFGINLQDLFGQGFPRRTRRRRMSVAEARKVLVEQEVDHLIDQDRLQAEAIYRAEQNGIIFIDEIDKIAEPGRGGYGPDVSREGVQRDILPIVEGTTVLTKYGPVRTDHILFVAAGAFHLSRPSDLIPELQGRFPIRVELEPLTAADFRRILVEPENALTKQYSALLATEGVELEWTEDGIEEIAELAQRVNEGTENIGARRLHTLLEKLLEDLSFRAPELAPATVRIDRDFVRRQLADVVADTDLSRYIL
ncbi:MAG: ATP-dependent protease ATPase subunit HslU [Firmicutes bacterium]|nr:ATP-dependent protease ATPase subunit HslU [Bacillota bacterium]